MIHARNFGAFRASFKEALVAYSFDFGGILAGFIVASQLDAFKFYPWSIAVYPAILSARGMIGGLFSGHLGTALHVGTIYPRLFRNTRNFYVLFEAIVVVTLETSLAMSLFSVAFGSLLWGITLSDALGILVIVMATMSLGLVLSLFTAALAFITFKRGLDPDVIEYPIMSTVADIFITVCYVLMLYLYVISSYAAVPFVLVHVALVLYVLYRNFRAREFVKTVKESFLTLIVVAFVVNVTGTVLRSISLEGNNEVYTVYPALIDLVGDVGSVIGSTATTKLALGSLEPSLSSLRNHSTQVFSAWSASVVMFVFFSVLSLLVNGIFTFHGFLSFTSVLLLANVIAVAIIVLVSFGVAILTFQKGLDPDNFVIPIESSLADSMTSIALVVALSLAALL